MPFNNRPQLGKNSPDLIPFLGALSLFLSVLEYLFPKPVPFFRLGLANLPILLGLPVLSTAEVFQLLLLKVLGQALINGTLASYVFLFSLAGSTASTLVMFALQRLVKNKVSFLGLSCAGALASNVVQVSLSLGFVFGSSAWLIAPLFLILGFFAGCGTGIFAQVFANTSQWYKELESSEASETDPLTEKKRRRSWRAPASWDVLGKVFSANTLFFMGIAIIPLFLFQNSLSWRLVQIGLFILLLILAGKRLQISYFLLMTLTICFFNLFLPNGKVLFSVAGLSITEGALLQGLYKGLGISGLVFISLAWVRKGLIFPGTLGRLLGLRFWYYERLMLERPHFRRDGFIKTLDLILYRLAQMKASDALEAGQKSGKDKAGQKTGGRIKAYGLLFLVFFILIFPLFQANLLIFSFN